MTDIKQQSTELQTAVDAAVTDAVASDAAGKKFYLSKTFWWNLVVAGGLLLQSKYGFIFSPEWQLLALTGINMALRAATKEPITW